MAAAETARKEAGPSRPPARPKNPSRHHLEPNPFEQSFSSKPGGSASPDSDRANGSAKSEAKGSRSDAGGKDDGDNKGSEAARGEHGKKLSNSGPLTPGSALTKNARILPPASSIASPAGQETSMHYPWSSSLSGSLRAGPLSPAMLAGPQNFDSFRTGFTPDLSNFKTGLTPLGAAGGSYPPPSPNTAAFLAMMNSTGGSGLSGAPITPGTLSALTGNPMDAQGPNGAQHGDGQKNNGDGNDAQDFGYFERQNDAGGKTSSSRMTIESHGQNSQQDRSAPSNSNAREGGVGGTKQAASGLYLLSQAHRELSKREEGQGHAGPNANNSQVQGVGGYPDLKAHSLYSDVPPNAGNSAGGKGPNSKGPAKRKKSGAESEAPSSNFKATPKKAKPEMADFGSPDYESDELGDEMPPGSYMPGRAGSQAGSDGAGNEEEKRKNFLERNRQAALKCRQRKKAWLASLQAKVEYLQADNEGLQGTVGALRNEVIFLKSQLMQAQRQLAQHGLGPPPPPGMDGGPPAGQMAPRGHMAGPMDMAPGAHMGMGPNSGMPAQQHMGPPHGSNGQYPRQAPAVSAANNTQGGGMPYSGPVGAMHAGKAPPHGARQGSLQAV